MIKQPKSAKFSTNSDSQTDKFSQLSGSPAPQHTNRRIKLIVRSRRGNARRICMHPTATFATLIVGVLMIGLSYRASATDYQVLASVQAKALSTGATITSPKNNETSTVRPIEVTGFCPNDSYVKLIRNGSFSGVDICSSGLFKIVTDLAEGPNDLQAQAYNITDQPGPVTGVVRVTYLSSSGSVITQPPGISQSSPAQTGMTTTSQPPKTSGGVSNSSPINVFSVIGDYQFQVASVLQKFEATIQFQSGIAPFNVQINWGDGNEARMKIMTNAPFIIDHQYKNSGYYTILITATDAANHTTILQLGALVKAPGDPATSGTILPPSVSPDSSVSDTNYAWLSYAWSIYGVICVMIISFWLGERREFLHLVKNHRVHKGTHRR